MTTRKNTPKPHRRALPTQRRSEETVELILKTSLELLEQAGLQGFTTNAVASRAGINVGTVYHYYPDKNSIIRHLFELHELRRSEWVVSRLPGLVDAVDVRTWVSEVLKGTMRIRRRTPGTRVLRNAIRAIPELQEIEAAIDRRSVENLSNAIRLRFGGISRQRATVAARVIVETTTNILDRVDDLDSAPSAVIRELSELLGSYLESLTTE